MMNGREINGEIGSGRGRGDGGVVADVMKRLGSNEDKIYDELFMMTLSRVSSPEERSKLHKVWLGRASINLAPTAPPRPKGKGPNRPPPKKGSSVLVPGASADDVAFYQDVFWALLNSSEFMLNH